MGTIEQYELLELIGKDLAGSTYRARNLKSDQIVTLRKFTSFGTDSRELNQEEQVAYQVAIKRLKEIHHPALRTIIAGGCDPNDGLPYVVSNWSEAKPLNMVIQEDGLSAKQVAALINQALEVCDLLSNILSENRVWIEVDVDTIHVTKLELPSEYLFWVSPASWLGGSPQNNGLDAIAELTEEVCRQSKISENDPDTNYIATWLKWMKGTAGASSSIHETREILAASAGIDPPTPVDALVEKAKSNPTLLSRLPKLPMNQFKRPKKPLFILLCALLVVEASVGYVWVQYIHSSSQKKVQQIQFNMDQAAEDFMEMDDRDQ